MKRSVVVLLLFMLVVIPVFAAKGGTLARTLQATLLVSDPETAADNICAWAKERGGYFLIRSTDWVELRFPTDDIGNFRSFIENLAEDIFNLSIEAFDVGEQIVYLESGIRARQEILDKNLSYIDGADIKGTLAIEKEVMRLLTEIESMKSQLHNIRVDSELARARITFTFRDETLPTDIPSSFDWINRLDFYSFLREAAP